MIGGGPTRGRARTGPPARGERHLQEGEHVGPFVDELVDRLPEPVTGVAVDPEEDRRVGALRDLERRRELERVPGPGAVVMVADER